MSDQTKFYFEKISGLFNQIHEESLPSIEKAAKLMADAVEADKLIHVFGPGGHSNMAVEEMFFRAGGLANINPIFDAGTVLINGARRSMRVERTPGYSQMLFDLFDLKEGELLIICNAYGINSMTIDAALEAKTRRIKTIAVTSKSFADHVPFGHPARHPSGKKLYELVDVFVDNKLPLGDAVVEFPGLSSPVAASSTMVNTFAVNLLTIETVRELLRRGVKPPVCISGNMPEGDKLGKEIIEKYAPRVKYL